MEMESGWSWTDFVADKNHHTKSFNVQQIIIMIKAKKKYVKNQEKKKKRKGSLYRLVATHNEGEGSQLKEDVEGEHN